jgi:hypothetical protein
MAANKPAQVFIAHCEKKKYYSLYVSIQTVFVHDNFFFFVDKIGSLVK